MGAARIRLVLSADAPALPAYNQDVWAERLHYAPFDATRLQRTFRLFTQLRETAAILFRQAAPADWQRVGIHAEHGAITLRNLLELYADHSERHIEQIYTRRAMLRHSVRFTRLLPALLY